MDLENCSYNHLHEGGECVQNLHRYKSVDPKIFFKPILTLILGIFFFLIFWAHFI